MSFISNLEPQVFLYILSTISEGLTALGMYILFIIPPAMKLRGIYWFQSAVSLVDTILSRAELFFCLLTEWLHILYVDAFELGIVFHIRIRKPWPLTTKSNNLFCVIKLCLWQNFVGLMFSAFIFCMFMY